LISSILIVLLLAALLLFLVRTMFRQRTLEEMRKDFTRNITHELKTPIAVATAATDALKNHAAEENPQRRGRYLEIIGVQLDQLSGMVEKILSVSVEGKENKLSKGNIDPVALIEEVIAGYEDIDVSFSLNFGSRVEIMGDRFHLKNVLATIIDNSIKYSEGRPQIRIDVESSEKKFRIKVADKGIGISRENLKQIFEKFYRVPQGDVQNTRGYGIGLHYAKRIIEAHGGTVTAESKLGKGTVITIELPL
ncbi:MAG: HAMP domain-containing histidine kinase, partial [Bacteroidales bacterium]|nr:HAMP domain-containing histidine kinase [Bacteroidales bacterium]